MSEATAGTLVGYLRLDATQWHEELRRAGVAAEALDGKSPDIDIDVNAEEAVARLRAVGEEADRAGRALHVTATTSSRDFDRMGAAMSEASDKVRDANDRLVIAETRLAEVRENGKAKASSVLSAERAVTVARRNLEAAAREASDAEKALADDMARAGAEAEAAAKKIERSSKDAETKGINPLAAAIGILGPAIAPVGAAAVGLAAGFGAMGAAGVLAVLGIKREMEEGTSLGLRYKSALDDAKGVLDGITHSGAEAFFGSLTQIIATLKSHTGALTPLLSEMTTYLGQSATNLIDAALTAFETFRPVIREVAAYVVDLSRRLNDGAQGEGFKSFVDYVAGVLPSVISTVESLVMAVGNIAAAASPLGGVVLDALNGIASAINAIDPTILQVVAVAAGSAYTAFVAYRALSFIPTFFQKTATSAAAAGAGMETASRGARGLQASMGIISIAIGAATAVYSAFAERNQAVATATSNYTDALIESNGAITENVRLVALKKAQDEGAIEQGRMLGLSTNDVVDAYLGYGDALAKIEPAHDAAMKAQLAKVNADQADASTMTDLNVAYLKFKNNVGDSGEALKNAKVAQQQHNEVVAEGSRAQGDYAGRVYTATDYIEEQKAALEAWKTAADAAITQTLSLEGAHDAATKRLKEANKAVRESNGNLKGNSDKALAARDSVRSYAEAKLREASEVQKATGSNVKANGVIEAGRKALYDSMRQAGLTKAEAQRLIDKYLQIPKSIKTNVDLASETAQRRAQLLKDTMAAIRSKTVTITVKQRLQNTAKLAGNLQNPDDAYANGGITAYANGGVTAFANGSENHVAQIAPAGAMRLWAEPETGGEAYIPLHPAKRDRSLAIWEETGKRLGALGQGGGSGDSEAIASALLALAGELRSLHSIPGAVERGLAQNARLARLDARARI